MKWLWSVFAGAAATVLLLAVLVFDAVWDAACALLAREERLP